MTNQEFITTILELSQQLNTIYHIAMREEIESSVQLTQLIVDEINLLVESVDIKDIKYDDTQAKIYKSLHELQLLANVLNARLSSLNIN